jgi:uncharacterized membrane protein YjjP (DUF1212 family)
MKRSPSPAELLKFLTSYARRYLAAGGPTSRLEESLENFGRKQAFQTEVFATPTGVFFTCQQGQDAPTTSLARIRETGINLSELCKLERTLDDVISTKISLHTAQSIIDQGHTQTSPYSFAHFSFAAFIAGFVLSFDAYQSMRAAWVSGFITFVTWMVTSPGLRSYFPTSMFRDFLGAFLALAMAAIVNYFYPISIEAYSIGSLVLLVPGLILTTAISELAEHNLVSGTAKLMQGLLVLLALGLAYVLLHEASHALQIEGVLEGSKQKPRIFAISFLSVLTSVYCFGIIFHVPVRSLVWASLTGLAAWLALKGIQSTPLIVAAPFFASVTVGLISLSFGRAFRVPSQTFSVPGIMALLPGMLALSSFRYFALGLEETGMALGFKVAVTATSIVLGLLTARIPFILWRNYREKAWT